MSLWEQQLPEGIWERIAERERARQQRRTEVPIWLCHNCGLSVPETEYGYFGYSFCSENCMDKWHSIREDGIVDKINSANIEQLNAIAGKIFTRAPEPVDSTSLDNCFALFKAEFPHAGYELWHDPRENTQAKMRAAVLFGDSKYIAWGRQPARTFLRVMLFARIG